MVSGDTSHSFTKRCPVNKKTVMNALDQISSVKMNAKAEIAFGRWRGPKCFKRRPVLLIFFWRMNTFARVSIFKPMIKISPVLENGPAHSHPPFQLLA
jgi:hypothetical protein